MRGVGNVNRRSSAPTPARAEQGGASGGVGGGVAVTVWRRRSLPLPGSVTAPRPVGSPGDAATATGKSKRMVSGTISPPPRRGLAKAVPPVGGEGGPAPATRSPPGGGGYRRRHGEAARRLLRLGRHGGGFTGGTAAAGSVAPKSPPDMIGRVSVVDWHLIGSTHLQTLNSTETYA